MDEFWLVEGGFALARYSILARTVISNVGEGGRIGEINSIGKWL